MESTDAAFDGSIPTTYERLLVPLIFAEPARHLAEALLKSHPQDILETAAGTGVLTRALVDASAARITATDLNEPMLATAAQQCPSPLVRWQVADALDLPFPDDSFDTVVCQFGVMFFPDKPKGYAEALRVLRPNGTFHFTAWDHIEANPAWCVVSDSLNVASPQVPIQFLRRTPYSYFDSDVIQADLLTAGFDTITIETRSGTSEASASDIATAICQGSPLRTELSNHPTLSVQEATTIAAAALRTEFGDDPISAPTSWLHVRASSSRTA